MKSGKRTVLICVLVLIVLIIVASILGSSTVTVDYYQVGLKRNKIQGKIDRSMIYGPGERYFLGPSHDFVLFPITVQFLNFNNIAIFTKDRSEIEIELHVQYGVRADQVHLLHKKFDIIYEDILYANALSAMKNKAPSFEVREYLRNRSRIEEELISAIRDKLSGPCCELDCVDDGSCIPGCKRRDLCTESDYGFFVNVQNVQLGEVDLDSSLKEKFLEAQLLYERNALEEYRQEATVKRKETASQVSIIKDQAEVILQEARATAALIRSEAEANATAVRDAALNEGLKIIFDKLAITNSKEKASFEYLRTLSKHNNLQLSVNFNDRIVLNQ